MAPAIAREEEEDSISIATRSSCISFECHHSVIFEELDKQVDYLSDEESDDDESVSRSLKKQILERSNRKSMDDRILDKEISAESHDSGNGLRGFFQRVASDLSLCSVLEDEIDPADQAGGIRRCSGSLVSMFEKRVISKEIKAGKIVRAPSMDVSKGMKNPACRSGTSLSFKSARRLSQSSCLSIDENSEVTFNKNATFQEETLPNQTVPRQRSAASLMGRAMLRDSSSPGISKRRRSADTLTGRDTKSLEVPPLASIIKDLSVFNVSLDSERAPTKKSEESDD